MTKFFEKAKAVLYIVGCIVFGIIVIWFADTFLFDYLCGYHPHLPC